MKLKKESKIRVLENFYALDFVLFGKPVAEQEVCCPVFVEEYLSIKGALMSLMIEMSQLVKHAPPTITEAVTESDLLKMAKKSAIIARENCKKLVITDKGRADVKNDLQESLSEMSSKKVDIEKLVQEKIRVKAFSLAVDNLLIGRTIQESKKYDKLNTWNGRILEDAYKILRDNLVEAALGILENGEEDSKKLVSEVTSRSWDEINFGVLGSKIKVALNDKYKMCKTKCIGDDERRKNYCVEKCRHAYYDALERNRANIIDKQ